MVFPFLPFMVQFLLPEIDPSSVGKYAGIVASAMYLGRFFGSYTWGALSDSFGHKRVLIISSSLAGVALILFGLSVNIPMAIAMKLLIGLVNGVTGSTRACMAENSTNDNQALGMAVLALSFGMGLVIGPAISGLIADPIGQYNLNITNNAVRYFLTKFPYFLPCFVNALIFFASAIVVHVLLPRKDRKLSGSKKQSAESPSIQSEDRVDANPKPEYDEATTVHKGVEPLVIQESKHQSDDSETKESDTDIQIGKDKKTSNDDHGSDETASTDVRSKPSFVLMNTIQEDKRIRYNTEQCGSCAHAFLSGKKTELMDEIEEKKEGVDDNDNLFVENNHYEEQLIPNSPTVNRKVCSKAMWLSTIIASSLHSLQNLKLFLRDPVVRQSLIIYCVFCASDIGFTEAYSLWSTTPAYLGGLNFSLSEVGMSLTIVGVLLLPFSLFFFPYLERRFGAIGSLLMTSVLLIFCFVLLPNLHFLLLLNRPVVLWIGLCVLMLLIRITITIGIASTTIFVNNSVTFDKLGSLNGLTTMMVSAFRAFSPVFVGSVYSVSLSEANQSIGFPVNYHLIFIIFGLIQIIIMVMTAFLPPSINKQKIAQGSTD